MGENDLEVRSYRAVFSLERRVYRIDALRLNPAGVPLRGVAYCVALAAGAFVLGDIPGISWPLAAIPWYFRDLALPAALGGVLAMVRIDGRAFHLAACALLRYRCGARHLWRLRGRGPAIVTWRPAPIVFIADGSEGAFRSLRFQGPGVALICCPHDRIEWPGRWGIGRRPQVSVHPIDSPRGGYRATAMELAPGAVLEVSCRPWTGQASRRG